MLNQLTSLSSCAIKLAEETITSGIETVKELLELDIKYTIHSGGALGTDTAFGIIAKEYGIETKHYYAGEKSQYNAPNGNTEISALDFLEGSLKAAEAANYNWGYEYKHMKDPRLIRNWCQVKYSDAIYAIGTIINVGEKVFPNQPRDTRIARNQCVTGGTGYAVGMAILHKKLVFVFDQTRNHWFMFDYSINGFVYCDCPKLMPNSAGIGTRKLTMEGLQAINNLFINTFGQDKYK